VSSEREKEIIAFLAANGWGKARRDPVPGDASTRSYERLTMGLEKAVLMNAPPAAEGPCCPVGANEDERRELGYNAMARLAGPDPAAFVCIARELTRRGFSAPRILAADLQKGLILLEDLGDDLYAHVLEKQPEQEEELYKNAVSCLAALYRSSFNPEMVHQNACWTVQDYDPLALQAEVDLFLEWFAPAFDGAVDDVAKAEWTRLWQEAFKHLDAHAPGLALRDFHAENIFVLPDREGTSNVGLIDFQDALFAHTSYDLVSLLEDSRRDVDPVIVPGLISQFCQETGIVEDEKFHAAYAVQAAQRNAKILGIFVRLAKRDGKQKYLELLPRVATHFMHDLSHPAMDGLRDWLRVYTPSVFLQSPESKLPADAKPITTAMVMAAGHGTRMRPLTDNTCKALVKVGGKALIDHMLDRLNEAGIKRAVVNVHAFADQLEAHLKLRTTGPEIVISDERDELLETGGGVVKALPLLGDDPILICNIDAVWTEAFSEITTLIGEWDAIQMDELFMLAPIEKTLGYYGPGDFETAFDYLLVRRRKETAPYVYAGVQIFKPELATGFKQEKFSRNKIWDESLKRSKIFGYVMSGLWMHVGDPEALKAAEAVLKDQG